jgi:hypothetical protein
LLGFGADFFTGEVYGRTFSTIGSTGWYLGSSIGVSADLDATGRPRRIDLILAIFHTQI